ncbi:hypothetical protein [Burkholderia territorii]|uniref:hypothetical protein n=1 Tax=Burkholderia territorii TaxID=1503055 RepID=UPI0012DA69F4|nr:hypothetical protein [Burkholderia territorii]
MTMKLSEYCKETIFRTVWMFPEQCVGIYLHAESRGVACRKLAVLSNFMLDCKSEIMDVASIDSYDELVANGISEDPELRIFELSRRGNRINKWIECPLFLSIDQSLLRKWMSLNVSRAMYAAMNLKQ